VGDQFADRERLHAARHVQADDGGEHQQPADQRVQEELHRGVLPAWPAEAADDEVHRHEHRLEEHVEQEDVHRGEDADHEELEQQQQREVVPHTALLDRRVRLLGARLAVERVPAREDDGRHEQHRHRDEHERDSVGAERDVHTERLDPVPAADELEAFALRVETEQHDERVDDDHQRDRQAQLLGQLGLRLAQAEHGDRPDERDQRQDEQDRVVVAHWKRTASSTATMAIEPPSIDSA
jgi:hypothetical protein